nr:hypothetical protein [Tanacetum cinerariifolium]
MLHDAKINVDEKNVKKLQQLFVKVEKALYIGCKTFTKLSFVVKLFDLKAKKKCNEKSFTTLLELLLEAFLEYNELPVLMYQTKKLTCSMGLEVQRIHACPNDCRLYKKTYKDLHECPVCMESRYKHKNLTKLDSDVTKNGPPAKLLWYLPIIPRLKKLYANPKDAKLLRWHAEERKNDGNMRHVADSPQWKNIDHKVIPMSLTNVDADIIQLGYRPRYVLQYQGYDINGYTFYTEQQDDKEKQSIVGIDDVVDEDEYNKFDELPPFSIGVQSMDDVLSNTLYLRFDHQERHED